MSDIPLLVNQLNLPSSLYEETQIIVEKYGTLMQHLKSVSETINSISGPVRLLEAQRHNAKTALAYIEDIILYSSKLKELVAAAKFDNIPYAAALCNEISQIPIRIPMQETSEFLRIKAEVSEKVKKRFGEALSENNKEIVEQYAGLFHHLELGREGIERYIQYIIESTCGQIKGIEQLLSTGVNYEDVLIKIFRVAVKTYDGQQENIRKEFGMQGSLELLQSLQSLVDAHAVSIIDKYSAEIASRAKSQGLCEEMSKIIKHSESFESYLNRLGKSIIASGENPIFDSKYSKETGLLKMSEIKSKILELADNYISLESQQMRISITGLLSKVSISQYADKNYLQKEVLNTGPIFDAIDECFFLVQNAGNRGLSTLNINSICAILNNISTLIAEEIVEMLLKKATGFKVSWSNQFTSFIALIISLLNLITICKKCVRKLVLGIDAQFNKIFGASGSDIVMFKHCLAAIAESEGKIALIEDGVIGTCLKSFQASGLLSGFRGINYEISLEVHADYEVNDPFALKLVKDVKTLTKQWKIQLFPEVFEKVLDGVAEDLSKALEVETRNKKFNELGALQFQKDVREIISQLQHMSNKPLRHRFIRLKQISELILSQDPEEIQNFSQDSEWKLSERETQGFRRLRTS